MWALFLGIATPKRYRNICPATLMRSTSPYRYGCSEMEKESIILRATLKCLGLLPPKIMGWGRNGLIFLGRIGVGCIGH